MRTFNPAALEQPVVLLLLTARARAKATSQPYKFSFPRSLKRELASLKQ